MTYRLLVRILALTIISFGIGLHGNAIGNLPSAKERLNLSDSIKLRLERTNIPEDSLRLLYDLFDLAPRPQQYAIGEKIFALSKRTNNISARLDILRQMTNLSQRNDSLRNILLREVMLLPPSDEQKATELFIRMSITNSHAAAASEEERQHYLKNILKQHTEINSNPMLTEDDLYERIDRINSICAYLSHMSKGQLLTKYLEEFGTLINRLPRQLDAITNIYLTQLANTYTYIGEPRKSINADKELIKNIRRMQGQYIRSGRRFRNYNPSLYNCYRRILSNYEALTPNEIEEYHNKILELAAIDPDVATEMETVRRPQIYYAMATNQYNKAIELITKEREHNPNSAVNLRLLKMLITAAKAVKNNTILLDATMQYNEELEKYIQNRSHERYRELQIMYDVSQLRNDNAELKESQDEAQIFYHRKMVIIGLFCIFILAIMLGIILFMYRRALKQSKFLSETNARLSEESENLRRTQRDLIEARDNANSAEKLKTEFISNMSHEVEAPLSAIVEYSQLIVDSVSDDKKVYLTRFANVVTLSAELLQTLVNDVLTINTADNNQLIIKRIPCRVNELCIIAINTVKKLVNPGVELRFINTENDSVTINTDAPRVEHVLINLLSNAAKFTEHGSITLTYEFNEERTQITFSVTDTGPGIAEGAEDKIFERFYKCDRHTQGIGLGLPICRLISRVLKGDTKLDRTYRNGARFLFTIPI